jgi:aspartyl/asparaginyl-tRNA synthetase
VRLSGKLVPSLGKGQAKELQVESVTVLGDVDPEVRVPLALTATS